MKSIKEGFIERWRNHVAGMIALGSDTFRKLTTGQLKTVADAGEIMLGLGDTTDRLLGLLYEDLAKRIGAAAPEKEAIMKK